jgi:hypothetical protein
MAPDRWTPRRASAPVQTTTSASERERAHAVMSVQAKVREHRDPLRARTLAWYRVPRSKRRLRPKPREHPTDRRLPGRDFRCDLMVRLGCLSNRLQR